MAPSSALLPTPSFSLSPSYASVPTTPPHKFARLRRAFALSHPRICPLLGMPSPAGGSGPLAQATCHSPGWPSSPYGVLPDGEQKSACPWLLLPTSVDSLLASGREEDSSVLLVAIHSFVCSFIQTTGISTHELLVQFQVLRNSSKQRVLLSKSLCSGQERDNK